MKTIEQIAQEVIEGKWGTMAERKRKLTEAGYNYDEVKAKVQELNKMAARAVTEAAKEVVAEVVEEVKPAAEAVAEVVEKVVDVEAIAKEVIRGKWGNGQERKDKLAAAGYDYATIQAKVNELLK